MNSNELITSGRMSRYVADHKNGYVDIYDRIEEQWMGYHFAYYEKMRAEDFAIELENIYREELKNGQTRIN